jgi:hypothetical protein
MGEKRRRKGLLEQRTLARLGSHCERDAVAGATCLPGVARVPSQQGAGRERGKGGTYLKHAHEPSESGHYDGGIGVIVAFDGWEKGTSPLVGVHAVSTEDGGNGEPYQ